MKFKEFVFFKFFRSKNWQILQKMMENFNQDYIEKSDFFENFSKNK
jgi:hypothetical protein